MSLLLYISVFFLFPAVSLAQTNYYCQEGSVANGTFVPALPEHTLIDRCTFEHITFGSSADAPALITVRASTVRAGSLMRAIFGDVPLTLQIIATVFERDARLITEGSLKSGCGIAIDSCTFDVRTPFNGDTIAIDFRRMMDVSIQGTFIVRRTQINIAADGSGTDDGGLVTAIVWNPISMVFPKMGSDEKLVSFSECTLTLNVTNNRKAYGMYIKTDAVVTNSEMRISGNHLSNINPQYGSASLVAFLIHLPIAPSLANVTSLQYLLVGDNIVDRISTFLQLEGLCTTLDIRYNVHSHHGPILSNISAGRHSTFTTVIFRQNAFRTFYEPWNPASTFGNPTLIFAIQGLFTGTSFPVTHNEIVASRFNSIPILFPGTTDLANGSTVNVFGNYFASSVVPDGSLPMTSFAIGPRSPPRTVDLGVVYICSNTWPAAYVPSTTTTPVSSTTAAAQTSQSDAPTTWATVPSVDTLSVLVSPIDRPANVSIAGGGCPSVFVTRVANHAAAQAASFLGLVLVMLASLLF